MDNFRAYDQSQGAFRAIIPNDLLEPEHPARIVDRVVELLDLSSIYGWYQDEGNQPYHPRMMLKVLFYSYLTGTMSSRKMWDGLKNRADYIFLSGDQIPNFRTLNGFRSRHLEQLPAQDAKSRAIVAQMRSDEAAHGQAAKDMGAIEAPAPVKGAMSVMAKVMTTTAYYI